MLLLLVFLALGHDRGCYSVWGLENTVYDQHSDINIPIIPSSDIILESTVFKNIISDSSYGGAIFVNSSYLHLDVKRSGFFKVSSIHAGGAIFSESSSNSIKSSCFVGCSSSSKFSFYLNSDESTTTVDKIHCSHAYASPGSSTTNTYFRFSRVIFINSNLTQNSEAIWGSAAYFSEPVTCTFSYNSIANNTGTNQVEFYCPSVTKRLIQAYSASNNFVHNRGASNGLVRLNTNITFEYNIFVENDTPIITSFHFKLTIIIQHNVFTDETPSLAVWNNNTVESNIKPYDLNLLYGFESSNYVNCYASCTNQFTSSKMNHENHLFLILPLIVGLL